VRNRLGYCGSSPSRCAAANGIHYHKRCTPATLEKLIHLFRRPQFTKSNTREFLAHGQDHFFWKHFHLGRISLFTSGVPLPFSISELYPKLKASRRVTASK
jgi:hypothetical protein